MTQTDRMLTALVPVFITKYPFSLQFQFSPVTTDTLLTAVCHINLLAAAVPAHSVLWLTGSSVRLSAETTGDLVGFHRTSS